MSYESWRISYQSSEQAARSAYGELETLRARVAELEKDAGRASPAVRGHRDKGYKAEDLVNLHWESDLDDAIDAALGEDA